MNTHSEDVKVECAEDCGNSPKKQLLRDINIAFAKREIGFCLDWMTDDIIWEIIGDRVIEGVSDVEKVLNEWSIREISLLRIHNIITHGNTASVNGVLLLNDKETIDFCDVYNFRGFGKNSKIKKITSFVIKTS